MKLLNVDNDDGRGVVEKEQTVLKLGWGEVSEAITAMDYTKSEDALLYPLSAGALRSLKERKKKKTARLSLSSSVCVPSIAPRPASSSFSTSSCSCALVLTDCQNCLHNRNHHIL